MKTISTFFFTMLLGVTGLFAQSDAGYVANWKFPIEWWFAGAPAPSVGIDAYPRKQAVAVYAPTFDAASADFDATWTGIPGDGNVIANALGLAGSNTGANDFKDAAWKALYDDGSIYILLQWTDDDVTGNETLEIALAPYFKLDVPDRTDYPTAWYTRWAQFGGNKLMFNKAGFNSAMFVMVDQDGVGHITWAGTTEVLTNNLFLDDKTSTGSKTVKWIITIGYPVLTGEYRQAFNTEIWKDLCDGKGISFDLKVNDTDADDAFNTDNPPVQKPAEYWWNTDNNDCWMSTMYAGFLDAKVAAVDEHDAEHVANWQFPIEWWFAGATAPSTGIDAYPRKVAKAKMAEGFDAAGADFDATWAGIEGTGEVIAQALGLAGSNTGANDFKDAAWKALYDDSNMYILLQWTDDDVTGNETLEIALAPYFKLNVPDRTDYPTAWYTRWAQFGGNKVMFNKAGFNSAMFVNVDAGGVGHITWAGTTETLTNNLFLDDKTTTGSKTVKWIITIGYPVLTGEYRPDFNTSIWKDLNDGKGISFDLKVNDIDTDDAFNTDNPPVQKPAEYWWNTDNNDCWMSTMFAGFLSISGSTGIVQPIMPVSNFYVVTPDRIILHKPARVVIYNMSGQQVFSERNVTDIDLSMLKSGFYIIRADNEARKIVR